MNSIPIIPIGQILLVSIQMDMHDQLALDLQNNLTEKISKLKARGVIIDISSLDIVDSFLGRTLADIASMASILDAETVLVGMRPAVALTLVELGLSLPTIATALNAEHGIQKLRERFRETDEDVDTYTEAYHDHHTG